MGPRVDRDCAIVVEIHSISYGRLYAFNRSNTKCHSFQDHSDKPQR